jgi:2-keto-myo-inositol isomerase
MDRRSFLSTAAVAATAAGCATSRPTASQLPLKYQGRRSPWPIALDTATIRPADRSISLDEKVRIAAEAGYDAIELWEFEVNEYEQAGGSLKDMAARIRDLGLFVPSVIGLWNGIPATQEEWERLLPEHRRRMRQASDIGSQHIQVVPQPARPWQQFDPQWAADRYRNLLEIGLNEFNINPAMVFVQFLEGARTLGKAAQIAIDADHPRARVIPDVFHMYIGGSGFNGLRHLRGEFIAIFSINDAPASPTRDEMVAMGTRNSDAQRIYPGDGVLPLVQILRDLQVIGYDGCLSLELYNPQYHQQDLLAVARTGLAKTLGVVAQAVG